MIPPVVKPSSRARSVGASGHCRPARQRSSACVADQLPGTVASICGYSEDDRADRVAFFTIRLRARFTIRLRARATTWPGSRSVGLAMGRKLVRSAWVRWRVTSGPYLFFALARAGATAGTGRFAGRPEPRAAA